MFLSAKAKNRPQSTLRQRAGHCDTRKYFHLAVTGRLTTQTHSKSTSLNVMEAVMIPSSGLLALLGEKLRVRRPVNRSIYSRHWPWALVCVKFGVEALRHVSGGPLSGRAMCDENQYDIRSDVHPVFSID